MTGEPNPAFSDLRKAIADYRWALKWRDATCVYVDSARYLLQRAEDDNREAEDKLRKAKDAVMAFDGADRQAVAEAIRIADAAREVKS